MSFCKWDFHAISLSAICTVNSHWLLINDTNNISNIINSFTLWDNIECMYLYAIYYLIMYMNLLHAYVNVYAC